MRGDSLLAPAPEKTERNGKKVMMVDDDPDITTSIELGLERKGIDVTSFNDPLLALEEIKKDPRQYDLIITDIRMPKMNGLELYREIRKYDGNTPVCFMTAFDVYVSEFQKMFPKITPAAIFRKPIGVVELAAAIDRLVYPRHRDAVGA